MGIRKVFEFNKLYCNEYSRDREMHIATLQHYNELTELWSPFTHRTLCIGNRNAQLNNANLMLNVFVLIIVKCSLALA